MPLTPSIAVLGAGSWGTCFAAQFARRHRVVLWARSDRIAREINDRHTNSTYLGAARLPDELFATSSLADALSDADLIVVAVPSHGVRNVLRDAQAPPSSAVVISLTKGLEEVTNLRMTQVIRELWGERPIGVLTGPNLAGEILEGQPTASVIAIADAALGRALQRCFSTPTLRIYTNPDVVGCEIAGVAKNVMAIALGMAAGLGLGDNARATLLTRSLAEIARLGAALGGRRETFAGLAGLGDLVATALSPQSRNFSAGVALGGGATVESVLEKSHMVAEGIRSCRPVVAIADALGIDTPVADEVVSVCHGGGSARQSLERLMSRAAKSEFE